MTVRSHESGCDVDILVVPRASRAKIGPRHGDRIKVAVTAPPVDGAANAAVIDVFAKALKCKRSAVSIVRGQTSRRKTIRLAGVEARDLETLCG
jgi:uncharacterized protein (TIGR00251 family)